MVYGTHETWKQFEIFKKGNFSWRDANVHQTDCPDEFNDDLFLSESDKNSAIIIEEFTQKAN